MMEHCGKCLLCKVALFMYDYESIVILYSLIEMQRLLYKTPTDP